MNTMHRDTITEAQTQFSGVSFSEVTYVRGHEYTVALCPSGASGIDFNGMMRFRSVDMFSGEQTRTGSDLGEKHALRAAIEAHYNPKQVQELGATLTAEFAQDFEKITPGSMHKSIMFGQCVCYDDIEQLDVVDYHTRESVSIFNYE